VRVRTLGVVGVIAAAAAGGAIAFASTSATGLPPYTNGYATWPRINGKPFTTTGPLSPAHAGVKNVYASRRKRGGRYPNGTVVVKTIQPRGRTGRPAQVAVMRKVGGRWRYVEYELSGTRYSVLAQGALCQGCHAQARANDYVFTR
jgi:hypothetical protein